jgi:hypothetical protein
VVGEPLQPSAGGPPYSPTTASSPKISQRADLVLQVALFAGVVLYWSTVTALKARFIPVYAGELKPIAEANWLTMWTWVDYGSYFRYSPTGLLWVGLLDRHLLAPLLGIPFPSPSFMVARRLIPIFIVAFGVLAVGTYRLSRFFGLGASAASVAAIFLGLNKGFAYYFRFASTIATTLLILYAIGVLYFGTGYVRSGRRAHLVGYYVFLLLALGAWEQWLNLLLCITAGSVVLLIVAERSQRRAVAIHGLVVPLLIGGVYLALRSTTIARESSAVSEAQSVLRYPSVALMLEDAIVNASHHIASIVEPVLFPWPMLSQSVQRGYDMDVYNAYNRTYTAFSAIHYRGFADWYAGLLFGLFLCATAWLIRYVRAGGEHAWPATVGLLLTWTGFFVHLPIMYRTYFVLPGAASLLDYKHALSILGGALLVGWGTEAILRRLRSPIPRLTLAWGLVAWLAYCNYSKLAISMRYEWGRFPW